MSGKSTFINQLAQSERVIVSEIAGTTRDSIDIRFEVDGKAFVAIDTPGVRKKKSLANDIEFYGLVRAQRSIRRADLVLMFFDATETISKVDKQLVEEISEHYKPCIFVINKWDRALDQEMTTDKWSKYLTDGVRIHATCSDRDHHSEGRKEHSQAAESGTGPCTSRPMLESVLDD